VTRAWRNGRFVPREDPDLPTLTGSEGLFETILVRGGEPRFLAPHLSRLFASAEHLSLPHVPEREALRAACAALAAGGPDPGRMRVMLIRAGAAVTLDPFEEYPEETYAAGVTVKIAEPPGHPLGDRAGHKVLPYSPLLAARAAARSDGAFEVLFIDHDGALLEGSASNLFIVSDGTLRTPPTTRPILPGVTRAAVLRAAMALGIPFEEADLRPEHLRAADEAFLTGSLMEIVPIRGAGIEPGETAPRLRSELFGW